MNRLRVNGKKIWCKYLEMKLVEAPQDYYHIQVLIQDEKQWQYVTHPNGNRVMVRHIIDALNTFANRGWEFVSYVKHYKGNNATMLLKRVQ